MSWLRNAIGRLGTERTLGRFGKFTAAVVIGLSVGTMVTPEPMTVPVVGTVSSLVVGLVGVAIGGVLFTQIPTKSDCGCSGECSCS